MPPKPEATQKDETLTFLWTCMKNAGEIKIDHKAVAEALNLTPGAAAKRWSRLKQRMDAEIGAAAGAAGAVGGGESPVTTPSKGVKRTAPGADDGEGESPNKKTKTKASGQKQKGKGKKGAAVNGTGPATGTVTGAGAEGGGEKVKVKEEGGNDSSSEWDAN